RQLLLHLGWHGHSVICRSLSPTRIVGVNRRLHSEPSRERNGDITSTILRSVFWRDRQGLSQRPVFKLSRDQCRSMTPCSVLQPASILRQKECKIYLCAA